CRTSISTAPPPTTFCAIAASSSASAISWHAGLAVARVSAGWNSRNIRSSPRGAPRDARVAGTPLRGPRSRVVSRWLWIPACAGMNGRGADRSLRSGTCAPRLSPSLRRDHVQPFALAVRTRLLAPQPHLHAVEIKIDHRRGVEREQLAQREAADQGAAERLAQLRAGAVTERERKAREHRRRRRHQDRAEAQQASFADRRDRRHVIVAL